MKELDKFIGKKITSFYPRFGDKFVRIIFEDGGVAIFKGNEEDEFVGFVYDWFGGNIEGKQFKGGFYDKNRGRYVFFVADGRVEFNFLKRIKPILVTMENEND